MHMADALLSPAVGLTMWAASAGSLSYSALKIKREELAEKKLPMMAVAGAFVFAAQMINFSIPGTGSSGHLGGGVLLAAMLGGYPALLTISVVLTIQSLFFADGGLLALGSNIFNMGVIPCLLIYPLIFKPLTRKGLTAGRISLAAILSAILGLQLGALGVVLQTTASGISQLPFSAFILLMQPIHLAIGLIEGVVTVAILNFVNQQRPEILQSSHQRARLASGISFKKILAVLAVITLLTAGVLSLLASAAPDGLEWSIARVAGSAELPAEGEVFGFFAKIQQKLTLLPDYDFAAADSQALMPGTTVAGLAGAALTFLLAGLTGLLVSRFKRRKKAAETAKNSR